MVELKLEQKINQNVLVLFGGLIALGVAEYFKLPMLYYAGLIITVLMGAFVIPSMAWYTIKYIKEKKN
jgi:hypothetical protein